jgi:hypothetical protein
LSLPRVARCCRSELLRKNGFNACSVAPQRAEHVGPLELTALLLNAQIEYFLSHFALAHFEFSDGQFLDFSDFHGGLLCRVVA